MSPKEQAKAAAEKLQEMFSESQGSEMVCLEAFAEEIGSIVEGWEMRIGELVAEEDAG